MDKLKLAGMTVRDGRQISPKMLYYGGFTMWSHRLAVQDAWFSAR